MRPILYLILSAGYLAAIISAQIDADLLTALLKTPVCFQQCSLQTLGRIGCPLSNVTSCVCKSTDVQREIATCVVAQCNITEQYISTKFSQREVCNGESKPSRQHTIIVVNVVLSIIAYPAFILRFVARFQVQRRLWWDDWFVIAAMLCMIALSVISILKARMGFGLHFWDVPPDNIVLLRKLYFVVQVLYCLILAFAKLSIVLLYYELFPKRKFRIAVHITIGLIAAKAMVFVPLVIFQCIPVKSIWTQEPARCIDVKMLVYWGAGISIFEDLLIMILPISEIRKLKTSLRTRVGLGFTFALGSCACITSIIRLKFILTFGNSIDVTWDNLDVLAWSIIELFTAIICSCLICYRPLIVLLLPDWLRGGSAFASQSSDNSYSGLKMKRSTLPSV